MSAPDTNIDTQEKQHKPALLGIMAAMVFGVMMVMLLLFFIIDNGRDDIATDGATDGVLIEQDAGAASTAAPVDPVATGTMDSN